MMPLEPQPSAFFAAVDDLKRRLEHGYGLTEASFEWELESLQRDARLLPVDQQPAAGLALVELGTIGYEFSHLIDSTTMAAVDRLVHHATILEFTGDTQRTPKKRQD